MIRTHPSPDMNQFDVSEECVRKLLLKSNPRKLYSDSVTVVSRVPQGSALRPLFFLFINDLPDKIIPKPRLLADDQSDSAVLQQDLDALAEWES